jgi:large subunit ribosomal protein L6
MFEKTVEIPEGINVSMEANTLVVSGSKGQLEKEFKHHKVRMEHNDGTIRVYSDEDRRKSKALVGTWTAIARNMVRGVDTGWEVKLKAVYSHFPMKLGVDGDRFVIQNFLGEKSSRSAKIVEGTSVKIEKDEVIVTGIDREKVGKTAANIEISTKVSGFDRRVFQDGVYVTQKTHQVEAHGH